MTSYQKRKEEIKALKEQLKVAESLARETKHYFLAKASGKEAHAEQCKKAVIKRISLLLNICDSEKEILGL